MPFKNMVEHKRLVFVGFAFKHHQNTHAGYHQIKEYLNYDKIINTQCEHNFLMYSKNNFVAEIIRKIVLRLFKNGNPLSLLRCIFLCLFRRNQIFHFIYSEYNYKWLHYFKGKTNKIVCTYHQPIEVLQSNPNLMVGIDKVDAIILMTNSDEKWFEAKTGKKNIYFIPHGINTEFYKPAKEKWKQKRILMVGNWLRDFQFANQVFSKLLKENSDIIITVVTQNDNFKYFDSHPNLQLLSNISDESLLELYQECSFLFLPLSSFTANNAILEAASTGARIIVASNMTNESYFNKEQITILPLNKDVVCDYLKLAITRIPDNSVIDLQRQYVIDNFSWETVATQTKKLLLTI